MDRESRACGLTFLTCLLTLAALVYAARYLRTSWLGEDLATSAWPFAVTMAALAAGLTLSLAQLRPRRATRLAARATLALVAAGSAGLLVHIGQWLAVTDLQFQPSAKLAAAAAGLTLVLALALRSFKTAAWLGVTAFVTAILAVEGLVAYGPLALERSRNQWRQHGWPAEPSEIDRARPDCLELRSALELCEPAASLAFVDHYGLDEALAKGLSLRNGVESAPFDPAAWRSFDKAHDFIAAAWLECPRYAPVRMSADNCLPDLLDGLPGAWTYVAVRRAVLDAARGDLTRARGGCETVLDASRRLYGEDLHGALRKLSMERQAAVCEVGLMALSGQALRPGSREAWESLAQLDSDWLQGVLDHHRVSSSDCFDCLHRYPEWMAFLQRHPTPLWRIPPLPRILVLGDCLERNARSTRQRAWLECRDLSRPETWSAARLDLPEDDHTRYIYGRVLAHVAQHRAMLAASTVLEERARAGRLPETARGLAAWPVDPFSGEPMRYERLGPDRFQVRSVGSDGLVSEELAAGIFLPEQDIGFDILLSLH